MATVLFVRHADIDLPPASTDPSLNAAGKTRASALAHTAGKAGVTAIFTSSLKRTKQTAAKVATGLGLQPQLVGEPAQFAQEVRSGGLGPVVLVVGHSNTVPQMI